MLEIVAESLNDAWAFVRNGDGQLVLVRPPYTSSNLMAASEDMIERMIHQHGFQSVSRRFAGWSELIAHLRVELNRVRESSLGAMPPTDMMRELLADAPDRVFDDYLRRIESELIPARRWAVALQLLSIMNATEAVGRSAELRERVSALISTCSLGLAEVPSIQRAGDEQLAREFPRVTNKYGPELMRIARDIAQRHQVFPIGAGLAA